MIIRKIFYLLVFIVMPVFCFSQDEYIDLVWSDEFDDGGNPDLSARGWTVQAGLAQTCTRVGEVLPYTAATSLASLTYRSSIRNSRLLIQSPHSLSIWKASSGSFCYAMAVRGGSIDNGNSAYLFIGDTALINQNGERVVVGYFSGTLEVARHSGGSGGRRARLARPFPSVHPFLSTLGAGSRAERAERATRRPPESVGDTMTRLPGSLVSQRELP